MTIKTALGLAALLALASPSSRVLAEGALPGDQWEVTSQMSVEGMPMSLPARTIKVCSAKVWTQPPGGADDKMKCTNSGFKMEGPKATWKVTCAGPPPMTGDGEITRDGESSWAGTIKFASSEAAMTIKLSGRKIGECEHPQ